MVCHSTLQACCCPLTFRFLEVKCLVDRSGCPRQSEACHFHSSQNVVLNGDTHQQHYLVKGFIYYKAYGSVKSDRAGSLIGEVRGEQLGRFGRLRAGRRLNSWGSRSRSNRHVCTGKDLNRQGRDATWRNMNWRVHRARYILVQCSLSAANK